MTTKVIDNFTGRLTRTFEGDLNSGLAKFNNSFGYDPFSKPGNLTWLYKPTDIAGAVITDAVLAGKVWSYSTSTRYVYAIGNAGRVYLIDPTNTGGSNDPLYDTPLLIGTLSTGSPTFTYGGSLEFFNGKIFISSDDQVTRIDITNTTSSLAGETEIAGASLTSALPHPMVQFQGKLYVGNGNNIAEIAVTNLFTTAAKLSPALPNGMYVRDLDVTPDGVYMIITASYIYPPTLSAASYTQPYASEAYQFYWNGTDAGITQIVTNPNWTVTATNSFLDKRYSFLNDAFGTALLEGNQKLLTLPQNQSPMPFGVASNGQFLTWAAPEITGTITNASTAGITWTSLYYYGQLDAGQPLGLWRMMREAATGGAVWKNPLNMMVNNFGFSINNAIAWGKHYISVFELSAATYHLYRLVLPPAANTAPMLGVYETQNQVFSKRVAIKQIRFYTEPTIAGNGFRADLINSNGDIHTNGTFNYTFATGSDPYALSGALERIDWNPNMDTVFCAGLRITNSGTINMTFMKIEIDFDESGK